MKKTFFVIAVIIALIMVIWPVVILIGGGLSFNGDVANMLSLGLIYKIQPAGFEKLGGILFFLMLFFGVVLTKILVEEYEKEKTKKQK
jgi:membrane-anchored glycerophosphoryl diester phosphodiesterase (GDPDase)